MGLRSSDEDGRDSYHETAARMAEVKKLRAAVRDLLALVEMAKVASPEDLRLATRELVTRPEVRRAIDGVYEGVVE